MSNDSKLGLIAGVAVVLVVAVFFTQKPGIAPASIAAPALTDQTRPPVKPPAAVPVPDPAPVTRTQAPLSRDPLLWP